MTAAQTAAIRGWMAGPANIGARLPGAPDDTGGTVEDFDPYGTPPPFEGRRTMIGMGVTGLEDACGAAMAALDGYPLFTRTQGTRLVKYFVGPDDGGGGRIPYALAQTAHRLREPGEPNERMRYGRTNWPKGSKPPKEIVYARTAAERRRSGGWPSGTRHRRARSNGSTDRADHRWWHGGWDLLRGGGAAARDAGAAGRG